MAHHPQSLPPIADVLARSVSDPIGHERTTSDGRCRADHRIGHSVHGQIATPPSNGAGEGAPEMDVRCDPGDLDGIGEGHRCSHQRVRSAVRAGGGRMRGQVDGERFHPRHADVPIDAASAPELALQTRAEGLRQDADIDAMVQVDDEP